MENITVVIGLCLTLCGAFFAWHGKGAGTWATFVFGLALILLGGPARDRLESLSLSGDGVEVAFNAATVSAEDAREIAKQSSAVFSALAPQDEATLRDDALLGSAFAAFQVELVEFISGAGFIPVRPHGAEIVRPGALLRLEEGTPVILAASSEAFSGLEVVESSVAIPEFSKSDAQEDKSVHVAFRCQAGSKVLQASIFAMSQSQEPEVFQSFRDINDLKVVQAVITCSGFEIFVESMGANGSKKNSLAYDEGANLVLGVKYATVIDHPN